jgi:hypothetical protein
MTSVGELRTMTEAQRRALLTGYAPEARMTLARLATLGADKARKDLESYHEVLIDLTREY